MAQLRKKWVVISLPFLVGLCLLIAIRMDRSMQVSHSERDFLPFWLAGRMLAQAENPYDPAQWASQYLQYQTSIELNPAFLYPLPLAILLVPLGLLPFHGAYILWVAMIQLMILFSLVILISLEDNKHAKLLFIPLFAGIALFRQTLLTLTQGQVSGLFLFGLTWIAFLWQKGKWFWGGFLLGLLALKPNLGVLIIGLLAIWLLRQKNWAAILGIFVSGILILIAGLSANSEWISQYWHIGSAKLAGTFGGSPTVWGLGALISHSQPTGTLLFGGLAVMFILLGFFWTVLRFPAGLRPVSVLALAVTTTMLITPYTWTYDQLLLILPITTVTLVMFQKGVRFALPAILFIGLDVVALVLLYFDIMLQVEILNVVIPTCVLCLCLWVLNPRLPGSA